MNDKFIDIDRVIKNKSDRLYRLLPGFVLKWLKRILHQDDINRIISDNSDKMGIDFVEAVLNDIGIKVNIFEEQNIPSNGRFVVIANHPLGGIDGMALMYAVSRVNKNLVFPVNDLLLNIENLKGLFIPINKHGRNGELGKRLDDVFEGDSVVLYFPAGLCSRKQGGEIKDLEWKKTFLVKAKKFDRNIVPVYIGGRNSSFFYNLANIRKRLGLKFNIEMLFLVDEMFKQKGKTIDIVFGNPISIGEFDDSKSDKEWVEWLKNIVYSIKK